MELRTWQPGKNDRLCSDHFISKKKSDIPTSPDYVPSINTKIKRPTTQASSEKSLERFERAQRRSQTSEQARKALQLEKVMNCERIRAVSRAIEHDHGHYCSSKSPATLEPRSFGSVVTTASKQSYCSSTPTIPADVGKYSIFALHS